MAAYNPRANGSAERAVQDAQNALHKILNGKMHDWDLLLPTVQLAMNSKANRSTKTSPASLLFGVDINAFANYDKATAKLLTHQQLAERHRHIADLIRPGAAAHLKRHSGHPRGARAVLGWEIDKNSKTSEGSSEFYFKTLLQKALSSVK